MRKNTANIIKELAFAQSSNPNNLSLKRYFEAYHQKLIRTLDPSQDQALIQKLIEIDPARREFYLKYID
jgi:hypothetical protein